MSGRGPEGPALEGLRVLDLGRVLSGPLCGQLLADLGAEVIKVEPPAGDDSRGFGPFVDGESSYFRLLNRNKRGIVLDLKTDQGRADLRELLRDTDILIENYRPGVLDRLLMPTPQLLEAYPRLIVVSISGFGHSGPMRDLPAYDLVIQAMSGLLDATGHPGGPGTRSAISLGDVIPALFGALGALAAVEQRRRTGFGQHVDVAMLDTLLAGFETLGLRALHSEEPIERVGNHHALSAPFGLFETKDGEVALVAGNDALFRTLAETIGRPDLAGDPRFASHGLRARNREALKVEIGEALRGTSSEDVLEMLAVAGIPSGPVLDVRTALAQPQVEARRMVETESDGFRTLGRALKMSADPRFVARPAPAQGADDEEILGRLRRAGQGIGERSL